LVSLVGGAFSFFIVRWWAARCRCWTRPTRHPWRRPACTRGEGVGPCGGRNGVA